MPNLRLVLMQSGHLWTSGMRYLYRNHPLALTIITGFCRGFFGLRR